MNVLNLTPNQLRQAADLKEKIARLVQQLSGILGNVSAPTQSAKPAKTGISAAQKASQSAKMKAYWAAKRAAKTKPAPQTKPAAKPAPKARPGMSAAPISQSERMKAYWAAKRAGKSAAPKPAPKAKTGISAEAKANHSANMNIYRAAMKRSTARNAAQTKKIVVVSVPAKAKKVMSAAPISQSERMKAFWAAKRAGKSATKPAAKPVPAKAKKVMSAATKAKLRQKLKAYWAAKKR